MDTAGRNAWQAPPTAWLNALAQVAFLNTPTQGALVLVAIGILSPWSAVGAGLGAAMAIILGRKLFDQTEPEWSAGLGGYDCALVGLAWSGVLSRGGPPSLLFPLAILACLSLRRPLRHLAHTLSLPVLGMPGLITAWISLYAFVVLGGDFWSFDKTPAPGLADCTVAVLVIFAAMLAKSPKPAAVAVLGASVAALAFLATGGDPLSIGGAGLWAFTVTPALFAFPATLLPGCRLAWKAAGIATAVAAAVWLAWPHLDLLSQVPPLMAPLFIGIWTATLIVLGRDRALFLDPELQHSAQLIARAGGGTVALTGAGISTASGIPDYTSGAWMDPGVPLAHYSFSAFIADPGSRALYWDACKRFGDIAGRATPNPGHRAIATMEARGLINAVITQNVDRLHQKAGSRQVLDLHGCIEEVHCLLCGATGEWPTEAEWRLHDIFCQQCGGFMKPAVIAFGEEIHYATWQQAQAAASRCKVLLVIGSQLTVSSATSLTAMARANGAACVFITTGWLACPVFPGDRVLVYPAERVLPVLATYLGAPSTTGAS